MHLGFPEIIAIVLIVVLLFGPGRIEKLASEMGRGIRSFKDGLQSDKDKKEGDEEEESKVEQKKTPAKKKTRKK